ncbi:MAG: cell wall-binding repeat-containing protein [Desulfitobacteriaceae bacterium]|nr:cell wall-binding repeat-containing protein [Desulfitobacteriaceae bacterium]
MKINRHISIILCFILAFALCPFLLAAGNTMTWTGEVDTYWYNDGNWNPKQVPGAVPSAEDTAVIPEAKTVVVNSHASVALDCSGDVLVSSGVNLSLIGNSYLRKGKLGDGWKTPGKFIINSGALQWSGGSIEGNGSFVINSGAQLNIETNSDVLLSRSLVNNGQIMVNSGTLRLTGGNGAIYEGGGGTGGITVADGASLDFDEKAYSVGGNFVNAGNLNIWNTWSNIPSADFKADYLQEGTGTLALKVGRNMGIDSFGKLNVTGQAKLGGVLEVDFINDYVPQAGKTFEVVTCGSRTGEFASIISNEPSITFEPTYTATGLTLTVKVAKVWEAANATELEAALNGFQSDDTIKLTADINYNKGIAITGKNVTIDTGGFILNVNSTTDPAPGVGLEVKDDGHVNLIGSGQFNIRQIGGNVSYGVKATNGSTATVTNIQVTAYMADAAFGAYADGTGSAIQVLGNVHVTATGGCGAKTVGCGKITVDGTITAMAYINIGSTYKDKSSGVDDPAKPGYLKYSTEIVTGIVWVKIALVPPTVPQNLIATPADGQVALSWTAPASDGGSAIIKYQVSRDNGVSWTDVGLNTSHTFTGLTNGTEYTFKVRAVNSIGNGAEVSTAATPIAYVCEISGTKYATLDAALAVVANGQTIKLLQNITHTSPVEVDSKTIYFELGSYDLLVDTSANPDDSIYYVLTVKNGGKIKLSGTGTGKFNVKSSSNAHSYGIRVLDANSEVTVDNVDATGQYATGVRMYGSGPSLDGGKITVNGHLNAGNMGVEVNAKNGIVVINGDITAGHTGVQTATNGGTLVTVNGNINVLGTASPYPGSGVYASGKTVVRVTGNVTVQGTGYIGVNAGGGTIEVGGNVVSSGIGAKATPNYNYGNGRVTIDGSLSAGTPFIIVGTTEKTAADITEPTTETGFLTYSDGVCNVWIGSVGDPVVTAPTAPQNFTVTAGDTQVELSWTAPASDGGSAIIKYQVSKDNGSNWTDADLNTSHIFTGLTNGTEYTFKVRAINSVGLGTETSAAATPMVLTYALTITAGTGGSITTGSSGNYAAGTVINIAASPASRYSFSNWSSVGGGTFGSTANASTAFTMPANAVTITAGFRYNGGGSGGGSSTPTTPVTLNYEAVVTTESGTETALAVAINRDFRTVFIEEDPWNTRPQGRTVITMPSIPDVDTYSLGIPVPDLSTTDNQSILTINTDSGSLTVPSNMLTGVKGTAGSKAQLTIGQGDKTNLPKDIQTAIGNRPLIQLTLSIDGNQTDWSNPNAPVTVSIPYTPTAEELARPEHITVWYIDGSGRASSMNGQYDPVSGTVTFTTTHFSYYAVVYDSIARLAGVDRVETALRIAQATYPDKVSHAVLATAHNYPDALAGSVLASHLKAPILLVGSLEEDQAKVISYLNTNLLPEGTVHILGGTGVISQSFADKLSTGAIKNISRIAGDDRYATSAKITEQLNVKTGTPVVVVSGENYPDALAVSSIAAQNQYPILLVQKDGISEVVSQELAAIKPSKIYIIGLEGAISPAVASQAAKITGLAAENIVRIGGIDRYATSLAIAEHFNLGSGTLCIATGNNYPDALAGSVYAAKYQAPIILTDSTLSAQIADYVKSGKPTEVVIFGGEAVVSKTIEQQIKQLLQ